jgi:hypothetical protein
VSIIELELDGQIMAHQILPPYLADILIHITDFHIDMFVEVIVDSGKYPILIEPGMYRADPDELLMGLFYPLKLNSGFKLQPTGMIRSL